MSVCTVHNHPSLCNRGGGVQCLCVPLQQRQIFMRPNPRTNPPLFTADFGAVYRPAATVTRLQQPRGIALGHLDSDLRRQKKKRVMFCTRMMDVGQRRRQTRRRVNQIGTTRRTRAANEKADASWRARTRHVCVVSWRQNGRFSLASVTTLQAVTANWLTKERGGVGAQ